MLVRLAHRHFIGREKFFEVVLAQNLGVGALVGGGGVDLLGRLLRLGIFTFITWLLLLFHFNDYNPASRQAQSLLEKPAQLVENRQVKANFKSKLILLLDRLESKQARLRRFEAINLRLSSALLTIHQSRDRRYAPCV